MVKTFRSLRLLRMLNHPVFSFETGIASDRRLNLVQLVRLCGCFIVHTSRPGRFETLRQTLLSQGCGAQRVLSNCVNLR